MNTYYTKQIEGKLPVLELEVQKYADIIYEACIARNIEMGNSLDLLSMITGTLDVNNINNMTLAITLTAIAEAYHQFRMG